MRRDWTYRLVIRGFRLLFRVLGLRFDLRGLEHIPAKGPAVLAGNHLSYLDFTFVGLAAVRRRRLVRFLAKRSTFESRVTGPAMRAMQHIPVDRASGAAAYRKAARAVAAGELVGIFPEATVSRSFTLKEFKPGAATLAVWERVPLLPVVLWAPQRTFTVDLRFSLRRGKTVMVLVGEPIVAAPDDTPADIDADLRRRMQELLHQAWREYPDRPRGSGDEWWVPRALGGSAPSLEEAARREAGVRPGWRAARRRRRGR